MIVKGIFWIGLVWLCMPHGPKLPVDAAPPAPCARCADPLGDASVDWRQAVVDRLQMLRTEIRTDMHKSGRDNAMMVGDGAGEALRALPERFAAATLTNGR